MNRSLASERLKRAVSGPHRRLGLRARVTAAFALGTAVLSIALATSTYIAVRHTLIEQRENVAARQAYVNAVLVRGNLRTPRPNVPRILDLLENPAGSQSFIESNGNWYSSSSSANTLPKQLTDKVSSGSPARMRFEVEGEVQLAIGVPIPAVGASYYEVSDTSELGRTLGVLQLTLTIASVATTLLGAAMGRYVSRRVLRPVTQAATAAQSIAAGDMTTRLTPDGDSDLDRLVLSFNRMVDALQQRMERDARFASDVSHELRSPLMTLASGLSVMQSRRSEMPVRSQTALDLLADEVLRFQRMVQDLLEISRTDAGHGDVSMEPILIGEFVRRVLESYERTELSKTFADEIEETVVSADKRRLERVVGNLVENADRYAGGVTDINLNLVSKDRVQLIIDDNGPGVPLEERERIFERFARGASARARASGEGTGLGLSLVDEHVRLHGGRVWVEDAPGGGARFVVELPVVPE